MFTQDVIKVHFALLRAIDLNMVSGGSGLGKIFLDFKERQVTLNVYMLSVYTHAHVGLSTCVRREASAPSDSGGSIKVKYPQISQRIAEISVQRISQLEQRTLEEKAERALKTNCSPFN